MSNYDEYFDRALNI